MSSHISSGLLSVPISFLLFWQDVSLAHAHDSIIRNTLVSHSLYFAILCLLVAGLAIGLRRSGFMWLSREKGEMFTSIFKAMPNSVVLLEVVSGKHGNPEYIIRQANASFEQLMRMPGKDLIGRKFDSFDHPSDLSFRNMLEAARETGTPQFQTLYSYSFRKYFDVRFLPTMPGYLAGMFTDVSKRERAYLALKKSELEFRQIVDVLHDGLAYLDMDGRLVYANKAMLKVLGAEKENCIGRQITDFMDEECRYVFYEQLEKRLAGNVDSYSLNLVAESGEVFKGIVTGQPRFDETGTIVGTLGVFRNLSDLAKVRQELSETQARYKAMFENMTSGVAVYRIENDEVYLADFNPAAERLTHTSKEDVLGRKLLDTFKGVKDLPFFDALLRVNRTGVPEIIPPFYYEGETHSSWNENIVYKLPDNEVVAIFDDVTERVCALEGLKKSEERLSLALDAVSDGVFDANLLTGETYVSPKNFHLLGYDESDMPFTFEAWKSLIHPDDLQAGRTAFYSSLREGDVYSLEGRCKTKDGKWKWLLGRGKAVERKEDGLPTRIIGTSVDIDASKAVEEEMRRAKELAEAANRSKSEFLANMSHELRTPINGIMGMLQLLNLTTVTDEQKEYISTAMASSRSLSGLLSDILDLSMAEAGRLSLCSLPVNLLDLLNMIRPLFQQKVEHKNIYLGIEHDPDIPLVLGGDPVRIKQILFNLVGNAVKFTESGSIIVRSKLVDSDGEKCRIILEVQDTGIGIPEDKHAYVFETFTQVQGSLTRPYQGTGLGLRIVKRIAEQMGGSVVLESREGEGALFRVLLPMEIVQDGGEAGAACDDFAVKEGVSRILVVEDDPVNMKTLKTYLQKVGYVVETAMNGLQALEKLEQNSFDCILMDVQMPVMDGLEAVREIRNSERLKHCCRVPVVAISAHAMKDDRERFLQAGMDEYLSKPVEFEQLRKVLRRFCSCDPREFRFRQ